MKIAFAVLLAIVLLSPLNAPAQPVRAGPGTTNTPAAWTNVLRAAATDITNLTARGLTALSTMTNRLATAGGNLRVVSVSSNAAAGAGVYFENVGLAVQTTNSEWIWSRNWNQTGAGLIDTNHMGVGETVEMNWDPFYPSQFKQIEWYQTFNTPAGTGVRPGVGNVWRYDRSNGTFSTDTGVHSDRFQVHGILGNNDSVLDISVSRSANAGGLFNFKGSITAGTNSSNPGSFSAIGGGFSAYDTHSATNASFTITGDKSAHTPANTYDYTAIIRPNVSGLPFVLSGWDLVQFDDPLYEYGPTFKNHNLHFAGTNGVTFGAQWANAGIVYIANQDDVDHIAFGAREGMHFRDTTGAAKYSGTLRMAIEKAGVFTDYLTTTNDLNVRGTLAQFGRKVLIGNTNSVYITLLTNSISTYNANSPYQGVELDYNGGRPLVKAYDGTSTSTQSPTNTFFSDGGGNYTYADKRGFSGSAFGLTNGTPALATNSATAMDGQVLVKRGNSLSLEPMAGGSGSITNLDTNYTHFVHISTTNATGGTGFAWDPYDASTPDNFLAILALAGTNSVILPEPGRYPIYLANGASNSASLLRAGQGIDGRYADKVTFYPASIPTNGGGQYLFFSQLGANRAFVRNVTLECSPHEGGIPTNTAVGGVALYGSGLMIDGVHVKYWGSRNTNNEGFVLTTSTEGTSANATNNIIQNCVVDQPITNGTMGVSCINLISFSTNQQANAEGFMNIARFNHVDAGNYRASGQYVHGIGITGNPGKAYENSVWNCSDSFYNDTCSVRSIEIYRNHSRSTRAVYFPLLTGGAGGLTNELADSIRVTDNEIEIDPGNGSSGFTGGIIIRGRTNTFFIREAIVTGNHFQPLNGSTNLVQATNANVASCIDLQNIASATVANNKSEIPVFADGGYPFVIQNVANMQGWLNTTNGNYRAAVSNQLDATLYDLFPSPASGSPTNTVPFIVKDPDGHLRVEIVDGLTRWYGIGSDDWDAEIAADHISFRVADDSASLTFSNGGTITAVGTFSGNFNFQSVNVVGTNGTPGFIGVTNSAGDIGVQIGGDTGVAVLTSTGQISSPLFIGSAAGLTNVINTNIVGLASVLSPTSQTNYLVTLWPNGAKYWIFTAATNVNLTFTNLALGNSASVCVNAITSTPNAAITFASAPITNINYHASVTNGTLEWHSFDAQDASPTNIIATAGGLSRR